MTTLATLRDRVEQVLGDSGNVKWAAADIDEAIRQALAAYGEHLPHRAIATVTLAAASREVDVSALPYRTIERVWWAYDAEDPALPPAWREFEVWPGGLLFVNDPACPAAGDVLRIWYSTDHTLEGLDGATATTIPARHAGLIALGAAGFAVTSRRVTVAETANLNEGAARNLREWGEERLVSFYQHLRELARRAAAVAGGTATLPALDRWDGGQGW